MKIADRSHEIKFDNGLDNEKTDKTSNSALLSGYIALIDRLDEYLEFLEGSNEMVIKLAHIHGWRCSDADLEKGREFRAAISKLRKAI